MSPQSQLNAVHTDVEFCCNYYKKRIRIELVFCIIGGILIVLSITLAIIFGLDPTKLPFIKSFAPDLKTTDTRTLLTVIPLFAGAYYIKQIKDFYLKMNGFKSALVEYNNYVNKEEEEQKRMKDNCNQVKNKMGQT